MMRALKILLLSLPAWAYAAAGGQSYTHGNFFSVVLPEGWSKEAEPYGLSDSEKKVYGADFLGPASGAIPARISVKYYAPGNLLHKTHEKFIKQHSKSPLGVNLTGKTYGKVMQGKAGNHYAKVFERKTFDHSEVRSIKPQKTPIYEKFFVVPVKQGFYVLRYSAPMDLAKANIKHYEALVASFKPLAR